PARTPPFPFAPEHGLAELGRVARGDADRGAERRERLRDGPAEPASPAGHDRDLSVELRHDATLMELTRQAVGEAIDLLLAVERPERDADRLGHVRLVQVLHDDPLLLPHPRHA